MNRSLKCSVAIATFKRQIMLHNLIDSLCNQNKNPNIELEIIIVDNDINLSAKHIVDKFKGTNNISIYYYSQPIQNISLTRNVAIDKSSGEFIAIIDDDETADPKWIQNLLSTALKYNADVVFGYVEAVFPANVPVWIQQREIYFHPMGKTGDNPIFRYTTNCLIKSETIKKYNIEFDPEYGLSGGEDSFFFNALEKLGAKFVVCREAITYEMIPVDRTKLSYLFKRSIQKGNNFAKQYIELNEKKYLIKKIELLLKSILAIIIYGNLTILLYPLKKHWIFRYIDFVQNLGKVSFIFNFKPLLYKGD